MSEECIFCKIIRGDFNTEFVYETENTVVFKDINPKAPIHLLVCPKEHIPSLTKSERSLFWRIFSFVHGTLRITSRR